VPITDGWNYGVRIYEPGMEILEETWVLPKNVPME